MPQAIFYGLSVTPSTANGTLPSTGNVAFYVDSADNHFKVIDSSGSVTDITGAGDDSIGAVTFTGDITISDGENIILDTTTGTQIGTAAAQKLGFLGATPIIQQTTTSQTAATFAANTSGISDDTATWDGYTIGDVVAILRTYGLMA